MGSEYEMSFDKRICPLHLLCIITVHYVLVTGVLGVGYYSRYKKETKCNVASVTKSTR